ncbi:MAG: hypothetical protein U0V48_07015 [Anaerolineales bacterium]
MNTLRANGYLMANGYSKKYDGVKISLVDEVQNSYQHTGKDKMVFQSFSAVREGETLVMRVQYDPVQRENYVKGKGSGSYTRDLYMYLCLSMQGDNPKASDCYKRADLQMERAMATWQGSGCSQTGQSGVATGGASAGASVRWDNTVRDADAVRILF